jgi:hypothetical protein
MTHAFTSYTVQLFYKTGTGTRKRDDFDGISIDAAREIAKVHSAFGDTVRLMAEGEDYCEVWTPGGFVRRGTFAETTLVWCAARADLPR